MTASDYAAMTMEDLQKALQGAEMLREDLQSAHRRSDSVESIVIMGLIEQAATLVNRTRELIGAIEMRA